MIFSSGKIASLNYKFAGMKKWITLVISLLTGALSFAQDYKPNWESLDLRPVPKWFRDAKFGIFIHWGVYSVPGWCTKGNYAEWYQQGLQTNDTARQRYHQAKFGNRTYYQLADDFKAELFNPDEWAKLFERSGAKYIVLTSKHHDGFTLWPSKESNRDWGFPWNAVDVGPKRDLLGDLFRAVRKTSVHPGMYYSLYEWFNPLWKTDKKRFAAEHTWPQMKELINTYRPDVFWTDGDWEVPPETWRSQEFLTWLYNESPVSENIVVNDRWGEGVRFKHAGIYTPEYQPDLDFEDHYWEESRGMGYSYGYNREEDAWDYNSAQSLVLQLIDKVSRGGNFLLDIGPDEHGKIPPIMQERLLQIGDWLDVNGEAIYQSSRWRTSSQWSEGRRDYKDKSGDMLLKITLNPDPGYAVKEIFYTYNTSAGTLFAIFPSYPANKKLVLKNLQVPEGTNMIFLSTREKLLWHRQGENTVVDLPDYDPNKIKAPYAYVVRINNFGQFVPKPRIKVEYGKGAMKPLITLIAQGPEQIRYTTDGSEPGPESALYTGPFSIDRTSLLKASSFIEGSLPSASLTENIKTYNWMNAVQNGKFQPGISYRYYEPDKNINMVTAFQDKPVSTGITDVISVAKKQRVDKFAFDFSGYIKIDKDGFYDFFTQSDDGSKLYIDDMEVVDNDGDHGKTEKSGKAALKKGYHRIHVIYYDSGGGNELHALIEPEGGKKEEIPASVLFH